MKKTNKYVNQNLMTIARKCSVRFADLVQLYEDLRSLHIFPKRCIRIMNTVYKYQMEAYDKALEGEMI